MNEAGFEWQVLVNDEEQYSLWPTFKQIPYGWRHAGATGSQEDCLNHVEAAWTDLRPLSVRRQAAVHAAGREWSHADGRRPVSQAVTSDVRAPKT